MKLIDTRQMKLVHELADGKDFVFIQLPDDLDKWDKSGQVPIEILSNMSLPEMEYAVLALARQIVEKELKKEEEENGARRRGEDG